ncbi:hypothetical protein OE88DRAFT_904071 [Heliocybe sulcata]|uniref:Uncharacterized protein n=1 Tax=Heliocybe sulcata TaxID=5364 RepID=A0A5C3MS15_9AGAM|nr:hypothetical protein OE88DRAFT_904071 [Heliocybe sulcata]
MVIASSAGVRLLFLDQLPFHILWAFCELSRISLFSSNPCGLLSVLAVISISLQIFLSDYRPSSRVDVPWDLHQSSFVYSTLTVRRRYTGVPEGMRGLPRALPPVVSKSRRQKPDHSTAPSLEPPRSASLE